MSIIKGKNRKDPRYDRYKSIDKAMLRAHWSPTKYITMIIKDDIPELKVFPKGEISLVKKGALNVAAVEDKIKLFWLTLPLDIRQKQITDVCGRHADNEVTHGQAYETLSEALGLDYSEIESVQQLRDRISYLVKYTSNIKDDKLTSEENLLKKVVLFTALMERVSLFTQFYIIMSFNNCKKGLKGMYSLNLSTAREENIHFKTGKWIVEDLVREISSDYDYKKELSDILKEGLIYETELLKWEFEDVGESHITFEEVLNVARYNLQFIAKEFGLPQDVIDYFSYNEELFKEKSMWFVEATKLTPNGDHFDSEEGNYTFSEEVINIHSFQP